MIRESISDYFPLFQCKYIQYTECLQNTYADIIIAILISLYRVSKHDGVKLLAR